MKTVSKKNSKSSLQFDAILQNLEKIVTKMENGDLKLEEYIELFETGTNLHKSGVELIQKAQHKVDILLGGTTDELKPFEEN
jgi:exodeoxyribonuclease VII small subunit